MTIRRLREVRGMTSSYPGGWGMADPGAIPPPGLFSVTRAGVPVTVKTALQVDSVHTALRVLSNAIVKMGDLRGYTVGLDKDNEPYRKWLPQQPTILTSTFGGPGIMWQYDGRRRTVISMALFGEAFWYTLTYDRLGNPESVEVLNPVLLTIDRDRDPTSGKLVYWYGAGPDRKKLDPDRLTHIPFMALPGAQRGLSSIDYAGISYALAIAAMEFGQRWFTQGASPSFLLSTEQKLGQVEVERIAEKFLVEHSGLSAAHLPLVVDSGLKVQKISSTPDEAQFLGTLEYSRLCLAAWFGLPSHLVGGTGDKGNVWGRSMEEQAYQMTDFTLSGYTVPLEEVHSSLLPAGQFAAIDTDTLLRANSADEAALLLALRQAGVETQNEIRVGRRKKPPLPGGDTLNAPLASNVAPGTAADAVAAAKQKSQPSADDIAAANSN